MVAVRTHPLLLEIELSTVGTFDEMSSNLYATAWAYRCLIAHLMATFRTFNYHFL
jgi:hypothetical protein